MHQEIKARYSAFYHRYVFIYIGTYGQSAIGSKRDTFFSCDHIFDFYTKTAASTYAGTTAHKKADVFFLYHFPDGNQSWSCDLQQENITGVNSGFTSKGNNNKMEGDNFPCAEAGDTSPIQKCNQVFKPGSIFRSFLKEDVPSMDWGWGKWYRNPLHISYVHLQQDILLLFLMATSPKSHPRLCSRRLEQILRSDMGCMRTTSSSCLFY